MVTKGQVVRQVRARPGDIAIEAQRHLEQTSLPESTTLLICDTPYTAETSEWWRSVDEQ